jgi:hypothetical protein
MSARVIVTCAPREQIDALVAIARAAGRDRATPAEARALLHLLA